MGSGRLCFLWSLSDSLDTKLFEGPLRIHDSSKLSVTRSPISGLRNYVKVPEMLHGNPG